MRRKLTYANVMATLAFFFALSGGAMAVTKYLTANDPIVAGDLAGSTYGDPVIADGAVANAKLANSSVRIDADAGLTGGGEVALGGSATIGADETTLQHRLDGGCSLGSAIRSVDQEGASTCQPTGVPFVTKVVTHNETDDFAVIARCPFGERVVGGGFDTVYDVEESSPSGNDAWIVLTKATAPAGAIVAEALCVPVS
jgi:hypothetical protein